MIRNIRRCFMNEKSDSTWTQWFSHSVLMELLWVQNAELKGESEVALQDPLVLVLHYSTWHHSWLIFYEMCLCRQARPLSAVWHQARQRRCVSRALSSSLQLGAEVTAHISPLPTYAIKIQFPFQSRLVVSLVCLSLFSCDAFPVSPFPYVCIHLWNRRILLTVPRGGSWKVFMFHCRLEHSVMSL